MPSTFVKYLSRNFKNSFLKFFLTGHKLIETLFWCDVSCQLEEFKIHVPVCPVAVTDSKALTLSCQMEIPAANLVNKYIAAQGPLPHTCAQFWQVVWDQKLSLIVMLTTLTERGRVSGLISNSDVCMSRCVLWNMSLRVKRVLNVAQCNPSVTQSFCKELLMDFSNDGQLSPPAAHTLAFSKLKNDRTAPPTLGSGPLFQARALPRVSPHLPRAPALASPTQDKCWSSEERCGCQVHRGGKT